jgi:hypothetical protein
MADLRPLKCNLSNICYIVNLPSLYLSLDLCPGENPWSSLPEGTIPGYTDTTGGYRNNASPIANGTNSTAAIAAGAEPVRTGVCITLVWTAEWCTLSCGRLPVLTGGGTLVSTGTDTTGAVAGTFTSGFE